MADRVATEARSDASDQSRLLSAPLTASPTIAPTVAVAVTAPFRPRMSWIEREAARRSEKLAARKREEVETRDAEEAFWNGCRAQYEAIAAAHRFFLIGPGQRVGTKHVAQRILGQGTFGTVLECRDDRSGERVAVKVAHCNNEAHELALAEEKATRSLPPHPACVPLLAAFDVIGFDEARRYGEKQHRCLVYPLLGASTYATQQRVVCDNGRRQQRSLFTSAYSLAQVRRMTYQLFAAIAHMHQHDVVHTDHKPENVVSRHVDAARRRHPHTARVVHERAPLRPAPPFSSVPSSAAHFSSSPPPVSTSGLQLSRGRRPRIRRRRHHLLSADLDGDEAVRGGDGDTSDARSDAGEPGVKHARQQASVGRQTRNGDGACSDGDGDSDEKGAEERQLARPDGDGVGIVVRDEVKTRSTSPPPPRSNATASENGDSDDGGADHSDDDVCAIDLGCALHLRPGEKRCGVISSREYQSPEALLMLPWDRSTDVWSGACVAYEWLVGTYLFPARDSELHLRMMDRALGPFPAGMARAALAAEHERDKLPRHRRSADHEPRDMRFSVTFTRDGEFCGERLGEVPALAKLWHHFPRLEDSVPHVEFQTFLAAALTYDPEVRPSAETLLTHPFFDALSPEYRARFWPPTERETSTDRRSDSSSSSSSSAAASAAVVSHRPSSE